MGKDKKKSKKEKKKELEEKRRLEEELLRQQQEEERKRQEELALKKKEEEEERQRLLQKKRREELVRLDKERSLDIETIAKRESDLKKFEKEYNDTLNWRKHILCDSLPDSSIEKHLNDFLTIWTSISLNPNNRCPINVANLYSNDNINNNNNNDEDIILSYDEKIINYCNKYQCNDSVSYRNIDINNILNEIKPIIQDVNFGYELVPQIRNQLYQGLQSYNFNLFNYAKNRLKFIANIGNFKIKQLTQYLLRNDYFINVSNTLNLDNDYDDNNNNNNNENNENNNTSNNNNNQDDNNNDDPTVTTTTAVNNKDSDSDTYAQKEVSEYFISYGLWSSALANAFKNIKIDFNTLNISIELPKQVPMKAGMPLALNVIQLKYDLLMRMKNEKLEFTYDDTIADNTDTIANNNNNNNNNNAALNEIIYEPIGPIIIVYLYRLPQAPSMLREWQVQTIESEYEKPTIWEYAADIKPDPSNPETITISYHIPNDIVVEIESPIKDIDTKPTDNIQLSKDVSKEPQNETQNQNETETAADTETKHETEIEQENEKQTENEPEIKEKEVEIEKQKEKEIEIEDKIDETIMNTIQLGWWNHESMKWDPNDFKDIKSEFIDTNNNNSNNNSINQNRRRITFTTSHIGTPIALIKPINIDFTYKNWKLIPFGVERCKIELIGKRYTFEFEIIDAEVQLLQPKLPQISKLLNKLMKPSQLIRYLNECGINLCSQLMNTQTNENEITEIKISENNENTTQQTIEDTNNNENKEQEQEKEQEQTKEEEKPTDTEKKETIEDNTAVTEKTEKADDTNTNNNNNDTKDNKNKIKTKKIYHFRKSLSIQSKANLEISTIATLFDITKSKWNLNSNINNDTIIFRVRKPLSISEQNDMDINDDINTWMTVMINQEKCTLIQCTESDKKLNIQTPLSELSHTTLLRCLESHCDHDMNIRDTDRHASFRFQETVRRLLNLISIFNV